MTTRSRHTFSFRRPPKKSDLHREQQEESSSPLLGRNLTGNPLTEREIEVLQWVAEGRNNEEIAAGLFITKNTVMTTLQHIYHKMGINTSFRQGRRSETRVNAVTIGFRRGLIK